ncbi:MAG: DUF4838 domain-containing protein [Saprospiraceae bacterium]
MKNQIYFLLFILSISSCKDNSTVSLNNNQNTNFVISLLENAEKDEILAAEELKKYLSNISNVDFSIEKNSKFSPKIIIGKSENLDAHTIHYGFKNNDFVIQGGNGKSTLYAVYEFLERELGCKFYSPKVEIVPTQKSINLSKNLSYTYTPDIHTRTVHSRLFYEDSTFANKRKVTNESFPNYVPIARVHTFHRFMPEEKFYKSHPEYYALRNGKRIPTQLCLTNETVYQIVKDSVQQQLLRYPNAEVISVSQDDNTQYCQCDQCEAIHKKEDSAAGSMIYFVNQIAKAFPQKQISTLAYQYTRKAPKEIKPEPNVLITLCSIECDRSASIEKKCEDFKNDLISWGAITDNIRIWDYTTQFTNFLAPFPNLRTLQPNIQLFNRNNAKWIFEQHSNQPSELFELRSYLTSKLLWEPNLDQDKVIADFLENYYETAAPFIQEYITDVHDELAKDSSFFLFLYGDPSQGFNSFLDKKNLAHYDSLFNAAAKSVEGKQEILNRVNEARISIDYAILEFEKRDLYNGLKNGGGKLILERLDRFQQTTSKNNITAMNEMHYTVKEYLNLYQTTLQRASKKSLAYKKPVQLLTSPKKYANEDPKTLTDGAFGSSSFYANWLGFEGEHLEAIIDLGEVKTINEISAGFLQVTNHIVFFPKQVSYEISMDGKKFQPIATLPNQFPLTKKSKINHIQYFTSQGIAATTRFIKIKAESSLVAPVWHHGAGLPSWIFMDELEVR